jgi:sugar phosphate isomerase/epimerase
MEIGIFARTFKQPDLEGVLTASASHGIFAVHFNLACAGLESMPARIEADVCRSIREVFTNKRVQMVGLSGTFNAIDPDVERRREMIRRCLLLIENAPAMGTNLVTLCTGSRDAENKWRWHDGNAADDAWRDLIDTMEQLLPVAEAAEVVLGIEPETANVINSAGQARRLLDQLRSDNLKIIMDGANLFTPENFPRMKETLREAFDLLAADIVSVHAKDITDDETKKNQAAGTGRLDYETYFELIKRSGFDGTVVLHNLDESQVDAGAAFVKRHAAKWYPELYSGEARL